MNKDFLIIVRGGGDLATGCIHKLVKSGFRVLILETAKPAAIRRKVCFGEAVYEGRVSVEGLEAVLADGNALLTKDVGRKLALEAVLLAIWEKGQIPVLVDPEGESIRLLKPAVVVDAILAKRNLGTCRTMAPFTIGIGPGFAAGQDVDLVIETRRGHDLGRILTSGCAAPNSGIPGNIGGYAAERVIHAGAGGTLRAIASIGDLVETGDEIARIYPAAGNAFGPEELADPIRKKGDSYTTGETEASYQALMKEMERIRDFICYEKTADGEEQAYYSVRASISGVLRGLIRDGYQVKKGFKIADIDPRLSERKNCFTISDKSRTIGGGVLEAVCSFYSRWMEESGKGHS